MKNPDKIQSCFQLDADDREKLERLAWVEGRSMTSMIVQLIRRAAELSAQKEAEKP